MIDSIKILWLSQARFTDSQQKATGTWLQPMAEGVNAREGFEIVNVTEAEVSAVKQETCRMIKQYLIPARKRKNNLQIPTIESCEEVKAILECEKPNIIHIWGTETIWAYMNVLGIFEGYKTLIDIQGLYSAYYYYYYYGALSPLDVVKSIGIKEFLRPNSSIMYYKKLFRERGEVEKKVLKSFQHISYQSEWVKKMLSMQAYKGTLYPTRIMLRQEFCKCPQWEYHFDRNHPVVFSMASSAFPYKGFHILLRAIAVLKDFYPEIELRLAGNMMKRGKRIPLFGGHDHYLYQLAKKLGISENVTYLGSIGADQIVKELHKADVVTIPSFVETYCLVFAEAMRVGVPCVASYAGAMPDIAKSGKDALFYSPMDFPHCAYQIRQLFEDKDLALRISTSGRERRICDNDPNGVVETQIDIYKSILNEHENLSD